jgi:hypothetical protein
VCVCILWISGKLHSVCIFTTDYFLSKNKDKITPSLEKILCLFNSDPVALKLFNKEENIAVPISASGQNTEEIKQL